MANKNEVKRNLETLEGVELDAYIAANPKAARAWNKSGSKSVTKKVMDYIKGVKENDHSREM